MNLEILEAARLGTPRPLLLRVVRAEHIPGDRPHTIRVVPTTATIRGEVVGWVRTLRHSTGLAPREITFLIGAHPGGLEVLNSENEPAGLPPTARSRVLTAWRAMPPAPAPTHPPTTTPTPATAPAAVKPTKPAPKGRKAK
ncbi:MAG: hypothetical protein GX442_24250 [Candidatus Riflebacteria bacterium]|nr:hypothetical protein [Candidatus Riflebacteria bacterium]